MPALPVTQAPPEGIDLCTLPPEPVSGLYVHVPFCFHKCHYCDFYSITRQSPERMTAFVDRLLGEARRWHTAAATQAIRTVFIGGGTPSLLPQEAMCRLLDGLAEVFDLSEVAEWTVEVNPATADETYLREMRRRGVDRVSIGAQSFVPEELAVLERHHEPADVGRAIAMSAEAGIERRSIDLIYAVPGQTEASWSRSLDAALMLNIEHMSCYGLTYEPNTPLAVRRRLGRVTALSDEAEVALFQVTRKRLSEAGLLPYEISNYARPGCESQHNLAYWHGRNYIGLGPSAASHVGGVRWRNDPHLGRWEHSVDAGQLPAIDVERLSPDARAGELAWLSLRLERGLDVAAFQDRTGIDPRQRYAAPVESLLSAGLLCDTGTHLRLTARGWPVADAIGAEFVGA